MRSVNQTNMFARFSKNNDSWECVCRGVGRGRGGSEDYDGQ